MRVIIPTCSIFDRAEDAGYPRQVDHEEAVEVLDDV
jgi:hypothetical protein